MSIVSENGLHQSKQKTLEMQNTRRDLEKILDKDAEIDNKSNVSNQEPQQGTLDSPTIDKQLAIKPRDSQLQPRRSESRKRSDIFARLKSVKGLNIVQRTMRSWVWTVVIACFTLYTLFSDDLKEILFSPKASLVFDILVYVCMGFFALEIVLSLINDKSYFLSFYFYLDIVSTLSMILDLSYFSQTSLDSVSSINNILRSAKTAKIGSRAGRIVRMFRIVGVFRLSKIFKEAEKVKQVKIERFDKELKKKREEREAEARRIKEQFADLESLR